MKTLKFTILLLCMLIINCCTKKNEDESTQKVRDYIFLDDILTPFGYDGRGDDSYHHKLLLNFKCAFGNDLVKEIEFLALDQDAFYAVESTTWNFFGHPLDDMIITGEEADNGGEVKSELYTLEYVFEDGIPSPWEPSGGCDITIPEPPKMSLRKGKPFSKIYSDLNDNYDYLYFKTKSYRTSYFPFAEKIIIKLKCTYVFGDDEEHEIITWWKPYPEKSTVATSCYRIEFNGKEYTEITYLYGAFNVYESNSYGYGGYSAATLIWDGK